MDGARGYIYILAGHMCGVGGHNNMLGCHMIELDAISLCRDAIGIGF